MSETIEKPGQQLIPLENVNAAVIFHDDATLDALLSRVREAAVGEAFDISTDAGRKRCASVAYNVARSKTALDDAGKNLVADMKKRTGDIDAQRRKAREFLEALKDEVRQPLTAWEEEQARVAREAQEAEEKRLADIESARIAELERREREIAEKEAAMRAKEAEAREAEARAEAAKRQAEREEAIRKEAAEKAQRDAQEAVQRAEREKAAAEAREKQARADAIETAQRAEENQRLAVAAAEERTRRAAAEQEAARLKAEQDRKADEERRSRHAKHRAAVKAKAADAIAELMPHQSSATDLANRIVNAIADGKVPAVSISFA